MSQQDIDAISETAKARRKALEFDDFDNRQRKFEEAMRAAAQLETDCHKFIIQAFRRGLSGEWRLDDEAIRPIALQLLHEFFDKPRDASPMLQVAYEDSIRRRDLANKGRLPKSLTDAVDLLLKQNDEPRMKRFLKGRPKSEVERILAYIRRKTS
jgi:hypothetical protein